MRRLKSVPLHRGSFSSRMAQRLPCSLPARSAICYDSGMRKTASFAIAFLSSALVFAGRAAAQSTNGSLEFYARITPTGARAEPVRQFTFYILTKSYADIVKEEEAKDPA